MMEEMGLASWAPSLDGAPATHYQPLAQVSLPSCSLNAPKPPTNTCNPRVFPVIHPDLIFGSVFRATPAKSGVAIQ